MTRRECSVLIIGGGPAGLSTALHLAQMAPELRSRIAILEKAHYPRPKLCGGGLTPDAERILERLNLNVSEVPHVDVEEVRFRFEDATFTFRIDGRHALRIVWRQEFDAWLAGKAQERGIALYEGKEAKSFSLDTYGVTVVTAEEEWHAQIVIGADGANSRVRRVFFPKRTIATARTLETFIPCHRQDHGEERAEFDLSGLPQGIAGYIWNFPTQVNGRAMHSWGIYDTNLLAKRKRAPLGEVLAQAVKGDFQLQSHPIRYFAPWQPLSRERLLLVGDAAGVDGLLGEGIGIALGYGAIAARAILDALRRGDFSFRRYQRQVLFAPLGRALLLRWGLAQIVYRLPQHTVQHTLWKHFQPLIYWIARHAVLNWGGKG
ncbi:MAG: NAD(P)/FAD-dependent oxidoreductase [Anaerolineales bacterium]